MRMFSLRGTQMQTYSLRAAVEANLPGTASQLGVEAIEKAIESPPEVEGARE